MSTAIAFAALELLACHRRATGVDAQADESPCASKPDTAAPRRSDAWQRERR